MAGITRRDLLKAAAVPLLLPAAARAQNAPSNKLNIGIIGLGSQGRIDLKALVGLGENIVAICDVDENLLAAARKERPDALARANDYADFRRMLDRERNLDAVLIATPDHWHAPMAKAALQAGKHVYCEKPLTHTIGEARELRQLAMVSRVVTQMGNQGSASPAFRRAVEVVQAGALGTVREVHAYIPGGRYPRGVNRPASGDPPPTTLNWDSWLGPAPARPYKAKLYHPFNWRGWYDFGSGQLGDFGCHAFNLAMRALDLDYPERVEVSGVGLGAESYFTRGTVKLRFAAREGRPPVTLIWYDGGVKPPMPIIQEIKGVYDQLISGVMIVGDRGMLFSDPHNLSPLIKLKGEAGLQPLMQHAATARIPQTLPRVASESHLGEWVAACKGGPKPFSPFEHGGHLTEIVLAGVLAVRLGHSLEWNGQTMAVSGNPSADRLIHPEYRMKWVI